MALAPANVMHSNGSHWTVAAVAAFWAIFIGAIYKGIQAVLSRVWVRRDDLEKEQATRQMKLLEDIQADVAALTGKVDIQGAELAFMKGTVSSVNDRLGDLESVVIRRDGR